MSKQSEQLEEIALCYRYQEHFIGRYVQIQDAQEGGWIPFGLWPAQEAALEAFALHRLIALLKARQLGLSWLVLARVLWLMLFRPASTCLLFSRRDDEATNLLDQRLRGMAQHLPDFLRPQFKGKNNEHSLQLKNGSTALAFPTTAGDSYTANLVVIDEADLVPDLGRLMRAVKPTVDNGGSLIALSRSDKKKPLSAFKNIYRAAKSGKTPWFPVFLPWSAHPGRNAAWYDTQKKDVLARTGALDDLYEQYPSTDAEALAPSTLDKRIPAVWLTACYAEAAPFDPLPSGAPAIKGLEVFRLPQPGRKYVLGLDPAEGNPTSDDSALEVLDAASGEEVASLSGKFEPSTLGAHADAVGTWFNRAPVMVERNNHGHAVLLWLRDNSKLRRLVGHDGKIGWLSNSKGKALLYDGVAEAFRDGAKDKQTLVHSFVTFNQLASIEGASLLAPEGENEDKADAYALGQVGCAKALQSAEATQSQSHSFASFS